MQERGKDRLSELDTDGFIVQLFKTIGKFMPPPAGVKSPALWGKRERLDNLFGRRAASIQATDKHFVFRYRSPEYWLEVFKTFYGPVLKTFAGLPPDAQEALREDLLCLAAEFNRSGDSTMVIPGEYLEVVIVR